TIFSFDRMDRDDFKEARVPKIQVVRAEEGTTMEALAAQSPITNYALDSLRVMNGLYPHGQPEPGKLIKIVD
ncbi:MAG: peptidase M48, partial [Pseudomonadales bacterium]|nr:peptidase M48 [Pseudomonadales bacterium]